MAVPFRKKSKQAKRKRRTHFKLVGATLIACKNCGALIKPHRVCRECGYYKDKEVIRVD
ncbi:50S ribosomal protein L32 [Spiroplasma phoeniceum]|uniref:Large ribosomal subunit protein bL32 n=1 Tax=Spiroplasma phoeniceum P40 TaxID=1276259 RepID=A0A345DQY1_9MOLU|nr:50S ribosomal protein L32 [Spiroplasma phoeniceum]AXF96622.1 50S ribosomal protein L32 [Spiroplasma phoeniceum P40]